MLLEEAGHAIDKRLNGTLDSVGDEGALFAKRLTGEELTTGERAAIQADNDSAMVTIDGVQVLVEEASSVGLTPTVINESENNNTLASANVIYRSQFGVGPSADVGDASLPRVSINGIIGPGDGAQNDVDCFAFTLRGGETITLDIDYGSGLGTNVDTIVGFYNSFGTILVQNDDYRESVGGGGSTSGLDSYLQYTVTADGTYYAAVTAFPNFGSSGPVFSNNGDSRYNNGDYVLNVSLVAQVDTNDAPTITSGYTYPLTTTDENTTSSATTASTILTAASWADVDTSALSGLAITATTGSGTWQYSTNGTTWSSFGSVSSNNALVITSSTQVHYVPNSQNGETATFSYKAWDQTTGSASTNTTANYATTATSGGTSAFSTNTSSAQIIVSSINDAPALDTTPSPVLIAINEDTPAPSSGSSTNSTFISALVSGISDVDSGALKGIAINAVNSANGTLYYSTNDGSSWNTVGTVSNTSALLLASDSNTRLYFQPAANFNGTITDVLNFKAWDQTSGSNGAKVDASSIGTSTAFSSATDTVAITVNAVNDAPTLLNVNLSGTEDTILTFNASTFTTASPGIKYVGLQADMGSGWRTPSTTKTYDIDSNNILGSDGWWLTGSSLSSPSYITSYSNNSYYYTNGSYAQIDNPVTTPGPNPSTIYTGTTNQQFPGYFNLSTNPVISFTLVGTVPEAIRLGIMTGNTDDSGRFGSSGFRIVSGTFDSGITSESQTNGIVYNGNPDWVFFDITGGTAGQAYSIYARGGPRGNAAIGGISFDSSTASNYSDIENSPLSSITLVSLPTTGILRVLGTDAFAGQVIDTATLNSLTYSPAANETGTKTFTISASDGTTSSATATVSIKIAAVNDAPTATAGSTLAYSENGTSAAIDNTITLVDVDNTSLTGATVTISAGLTSGDVLGFTSQNGITGVYNSGTGVLSITGTATIAQYEAALRSVSFNSTSDNPTATSASRTISWQVFDGNALSTTATSNIYVTAVNDAPIVSTISTLSGATEDIPYEISYASLLAASNAVDVEGDILSFRIEAVSTGSLSKWDGTSWDQVTPATTIIAASDKLRWTPAINANGSLNAFTVKARDSSLLSSTPIQVNVNVTPVNDLPSGEVTISGIAEQGQTLSASNTLNDFDGLGTISYQWNANGNPIAGAIASFFTLTQEQVRQTITVTASYTDGQGTLEKVKSLATAVVIDTTPPGAPVLTLGNGVGNGATSAGALAPGGVISLIAEASSSVAITFSRSAGGTVTKTVTGNGAIAVPVILTTEELKTLGNGTINVAATTTDAAGNPQIVAAATTTFTLDTNAPAQPTINSVAGDNRINASEKANGVTVSGTAEAGSAVAINWGGATRNITTEANGTWSTFYTPATIPTVSVSNITVVSTDTAGNQSTPISRTINLDALNLAPIGINLSAGASIPPADNLTATIATITGNDPDTSEALLTYNITKVVIGTTTLTDQSNIPFSITNRNELTFKPLYSTGEYNSLFGGKDQVAITLSASDGTTTPFLKTFILSIPNDTNKAPTTRTSQITLSDPIQQGTSLSTLTGRSVLDLFGSPSVYLDVSAGTTDTTNRALGGVAVVSNTASAEQGFWQYKISSNWINLPTISESSSFILPKNALIRFAPTSTFFGSPGVLSVRLLDSSNSTLIASARQLSSPLPTGGSAAASTELIRLSLVIAAPPSSLVLSETILPTVNNLNSTIATITGNDSDTNEALLTYSITKVVVGTTTLTEQSNIPFTITNRNELTFKPLYSIGEYSSLFGGKDQVAITLSASDGKTTPFLKTFILSIPNATNKAPTALKSQVTLSDPIQQGTALSTLTGRSILDLFGSPSVYSDVSAGTADTTNRTLGGVAVVSNAASAAQGFWQYKTANTWINLPTVSESRSFILPKNALIRFAPTSTFFGSPGVLSVRLLDSSNSTLTASAGQLSSPLPTGGSAAASSELISLNVVIAAPPSSLVLSETVLPTANSINSTIATITGNDPDTSEALLTYNITKVVVGTTTLTEQSNIPFTITNRNELTFKPLYSISEYSSLFGGKDQVAITLSASDGTTTPFLKTFILSVPNDTNKAPTALKSQVTLSDPIQQGTVLSTLTGRSILDLFGSPSVYSDVSAGTADTTNRTLGGVAVVSNAASAAQGFWQYKILTNWNNLPTVSESSSFILPKNALIRFAPTSTFFGSPGVLSVRLLDSSNSTLTASAGQLSSPLPTGGSAAASSALISLGLVNAAPASSLVLSETVLPTANNLNSTIATITGNDPDTNEALLTYDITEVVIGNTTFTSPTSIPFTITNRNELTFKPGYSPGEYSIFFGGKDQVAVTLSASDGTTTPFLKTFVLSIPNDTNKAPTALTTQVTLSDPIQQGTALSTLTGRSVLDIFGSPSVYSDVSAGIADISNPGLGGVAVVSNAASAAQGFWQYKTANSWINLPTVSESSSFILPKNALIRFAPQSSFIGSAGVLGVRLLDSSNSNLTASAGQLSSPLPTGGSAAASADTVSLAIAIAAAPSSLTLSSDTQLKSDDSNGSRIGQLLANDPDTRQADLIYLKNGNGDDNNLITISSNGEILLSASITADQLNTIRGKGFLTINVQGHLE